jgi:Glycosyl transferase family 2
LRIAIHNHYAGQEVAETEFSKRICFAASNLGWESLEAGSSAEIARFAPDFVIALHFRTPKLTKYPTYGSMVTPPAYFVHDDQFLKHILSYDGYLSSSQHISSWLRDVLYNTQKIHFVSPWYTSSHNVPYRRPQIAKPRLLYTGTNWDGPRYRELFEGLDAHSYLDIYGPANAWSYVKNSFRGLLPFDGTSIFDALHSSGVGLCLHRKEHREAATPSSRIFEIVASGAIAICQDHPFIRENFGDSVLYLDPAGETPTLLKQISQHMSWIAENQEQAFDLSKRAYDIYSKRYTLEKLLSDLVPHHHRIAAQKITRHVHPGVRKDSRVQFIVRVGDRGCTYLERALDSLAGQTCGPVGVILVRYENVPDLAQLLKKYDQQLHVTILDSPCNGFRSTQLWAGLQAVSSDYFGILDDDDVIHPGHVDSLLRLLEGSDTYSVAYSGSIRVWESQHGSPGPQPPHQTPSEPAELTYFEPFDLNRLVALENFITSNAFLARSSLLEDLGEDPRLPFLEDLFLLLHLCRKARFVFSYEATSEFYWRHTRDDNTVLQDEGGHLGAKERIKDILWKQSFHCTQDVGHNLVGWETRLSALEHKLAQTEIALTDANNALTHANNRIDGLTIRLNRYLNLPLIDLVRRFRRRLFRLPPPPNP